MLTFTDDFGIVHYDAFISDSWPDKVFLYFQRAGTTWTSVLTKEQVQQVIDELQHGIKKLESK